ncbi:MAG: pyruvate dehydrogenase (acetyl-transferring), homodimeric type [Myxococcales bacterium]|nr:pyruvate dehydrogenase (acetyl-transferring), homodimeric type [Myxococcales bacterium]
MSAALSSDLDPTETHEWLESLESVLEKDGPERAHFIIQQLVTRARERGGDLPYKATTAYVNSIPPDREPRYPGDPELEWRIRRLTRWNAMAMILKANADGSGRGGHIASFASSAMLYDVGYNHFWRARTKEHGGDLIFFQGHSAPGLYARAFLEGRLSEQHLLGFRQELSPNGLSSYPHPWLMPDFWQFPTVSMGLGPLMAIYQARFLRYLENRGLLPKSDRKIWAFLGDGETDEPESLGAIGLAAREGLDNLIFVINCNLQRLDGPVRGNGKIIQELEGNFRGAGWNVLKVIWGSNWDPLLTQDKSGMLRRLMNEFLDGDYQSCKAKGGGFTREHFFGRYEETARMVSSMTDDEVGALRRGGHDPLKVYAAYKAAAEHVGQPTVILAKTVKGYGMGSAGEGLNITHQQKKMNLEELKAFRDRYRIPVSDEELTDLPFLSLQDDSVEKQYLDERRKSLGGYIPARKTEVPQLKIPPLSAFDAVLQSSGDRQISTTMAFVRVLNTLCRNKDLGKRIVPIVPDESRTFGMEGMFRQLGIYSPHGQLYLPEDKEQLMFYKEDKKGQVLQEGINEAGGIADWIAAATSYTTHGVPMIPFYIFYSMFGFQRIGDFIWAAGDSRSRGFLIGGTAGRTTLNGEGLQHQDGHSHIAASTVPNCIAYDPTFAYEMAVIIHDGLKRMYQDQEDIFYYITAMNENYNHPAMPEGAQEGIIKGLYLFREGKPTKNKRKRSIDLLGCGTILREVIAAADILEADYGIRADVWSAPSFTQLARDGFDTERFNRLHPEQAPKKCYVEQCFEGRSGPVIAATDYVRAYADQIRAFIPNPYTVLGTDGFGRSDRREALRRHFEVDRYHVVVAALKALADENQFPRGDVQKAIAAYKIAIDTKPPRLA